MRNAQISLSCFQLLPECLRAPLEWWSLPTLFPDSFSVVWAAGPLYFSPRHTTVVYPVACNIHNRWTAAGLAIIRMYIFNWSLFFFLLCVISLAYTRINRLLFVNLCLIACAVQCVDPCCGNKSSSVVHYWRFHPWKDTSSLKLCTSLKSKVQLLQESPCKLFFSVHHKILSKIKWNVNLNENALKYNWKWSLPYSLTLSVASQYFILFVILEKPSTTIHTTELVKPWTFPRSPPNIPTGHVFPRSHNV